MAFDVSNYEPVKARKLRFYQTFPDGRITVELINPQTLMDAALIKASVFVSSEDQAKGCARGSGYAFEIRDTQLSKTKYGKEFESVNYSSWTENAEESAVGRALDNAGFASNMHCSAEEMAKAKRMKEALQAKSQDAQASSPKTTTSEGKVKQPIKPKASATPSTESVNAKEALKDAIAREVISKRIPHNVMREMIQNTWGEGMKLDGLNVDQLKRTLEFAERYNAPATPQGGT